LLDPAYRGETSLRGCDQSRRWLGFLARNRYQLIGATIFGAFLPAIARTGLHLGGAVTLNTIFGTFLAMLIGAYLLRRMTDYPGTRSVYYILPVFLVSFGVVVVLFFFIRLDYSRLQFLLSFVCVVAWFGFVDAIQPRINRLRLAVVPFGKAERVMSNNRADWSVVSSSETSVLNISGIVVDLQAGLTADWERFLARAALQGTPVYHWKQIVESLSGRVEVEHLSENTFGSLLPSSVYLRLKRIVDFCFAVLLLPIFALVVGAAAVAIWLCDGRPILFRQRRIGRGGRSFTMFKLRTMRNDSGEGKAFTEPDDPRVTRLGRYLRQFRIDEFPQIINILRGEMSFIGPRPEAIELAEWYESQIPFYSYRHIVRPGITGWAQVHQGNVAELVAATGKLQFDFYYIKYFSPWLDVLIAAKTVKILLTGEGSR